MTDNHNNILTCLVSMVLFSLLDCSSSSKSTAPPPPRGSIQKKHFPPLLPHPRKKDPDTFRQNIVDTIHGKKVSDPYRWLETVNHRRTQRWMRSQDSTARAFLSALPGRQYLKKRLRELSYLEWSSAPIRRGKRYFFYRQHKNKEKVIWYWREGQKGKTKVLLDPNMMSKDGSISLRGVSISWDGKKVAYKLSKNAADHATLHVMEVATSKVSAIDMIKGARYAYASWTPRSDGFFYTRIPSDNKVPEAELPGHARVFFHRLGMDPKTDTLVHDRTGDPKTFINALISKDGHFLFLYINHGWSSTDLYYMDLRRIPSRRFVKSSTYAFKPLAVGIKSRFEIYAWKDGFYLRTNDGAPRYRMFKIHPRRIKRKQWREIIPQQKDAVLKGFSVVGGHLALLYMQKATTKLKIATLAGKILREVAFPGLGSASGLTGNPEDDKAYYTFSSFTTPPTVFSTSVRRGGREVYFKLDIPINPDPFLVEQVHYRSKDKTSISMFIVRRKSIPMDGSTPFLLFGYGGFNISLTPQFLASRFVWLEQGGALAIPNLRGGGEYGEGWHRAGMLTRKQNTFDDFVAAAEFLIEKKYTSPNKLAIRGGSNGGLLVGAVMTQRPELFRVVSCHVPLLDMVRYHLFGSGKTWISEYGSADDSAQFKALLAYSPYHNLKKGTAYPALLMMSADSDDRVDPMHARKFTAALQYATASKHPVLLRIETKAGHGGGDLIKKRVDSYTDEYSFIFSQLGISVKTIPRPNDLP